MASSLLSLFALLLFTLLQPPLSAANHRQTSIFQSRSISEPTSFPTGAAPGPPTTYFEVTRPIPLPKTKPFSLVVLHHEFAYTYGKPPVLADYKPPPNPHKFAKIVLEWTATSKGRQYDRIFGVWLGGVEIFRSCTAEPRATGIVWTVKKDITRYRSLLMMEQTVSVYMGNVVDRTYNGVYHVNLTFHFYPAEENHDRSDSVADLILPISRNLPLSDGLWFEIENSTDLQGKELRIPQNAYRAVLEVYVSFHENDEFWFGNYPNEYISANNLTDTPGNGPFREVVVRLDDLIVGAVWPFTVIYTGGVNPFLWRPISGIGSFDLPSYDIEITPFLGELLDGRSHTFGFSVTNALNVWYIDANLHLWSDKKWDKTRGKLLRHSASPLSSSLLSEFTGSDGMFTANASRSVVSKGRVESSHGVITTKSRQGFRYGNAMMLKKDGNSQILDQTIKLRGSVGMKKPSSSVFSTSSEREFRVYFYYDSVDRGNGTKAYTTNVTLGINEKSRKFSDFGSSTRRLKNLQKGDGYMVIKGKTINGLGRTQQDYRYSSDNSCYCRNVRSSNYTILHDEQSSSCKHG